jgi:hypothetical protein
LTITHEEHNKTLRNRHDKRSGRKLNIKSRLDIIYKSLFNKDHRNWLIKRTTDKNWYKEKLVQVGLKKPTPNS